MGKAAVSIFYADDDPDDRDFLKDALENHPVSVNLITCNNGVEAINYFTNLLPFEPLPCLIILDVNMPLLGGKEVLQQLRSLNRVKDIPVVLYTTSSLGGDMLFARQYNAGFITKPMHSRQLEGIVEQLIDYCTDDIRNILRPQIN